MEKQSRPHEFTKPLSKYTTASTKSKKLSLCTYLIFLKAIESCAAAQHHVASAWELPSAISLSALNRDFGTDSNG